jgi:Fanconi anemia group M protein
MKNQAISITIDYREKSSGVPDLIAKERVGVSFATLKAGDYCINNEILIERKTAEDFIQSLMSGRLFDQCKKLRGSGYVCLMMVEGNPANTGHEISPEAIQGALLSVMISWQVPVYFVPDKQEAANAIIRAGKQNLKNRSMARLQQSGVRKNYGSQVFFLQGLPFIGPQLSLRLLRRFGSIANIAKATDKELQALKGIGAKKAKRIVGFFTHKL